MARVFNGSNQYCGIGNKVISDFPFSMSLWFRTANTTSLQRPFEIYKAGTGGVFKFAINLRGDLANKYIDAQENPGSLAQTTTQFSANTWHHALAVFASATSRTIYLDGGGKGTNTTAGSAIPQVDSCIVGSGWDGSTGVLISQFSGRVAFVAVHGAALTDDEAAALGQILNGVPCGVHPTRIRPESLVACWPLGGFDGDHDGDIWSNAYNLTAYNSPTWDEGPAVLYSAGPLWLPAFTLASSDRTATIAGTMGAMSASLSAGFTKPTYTASITGTQAPMTAALSASRTLPTFAASIAASHAPMVASVAASFTKPTYSATIGATHAAMTASLAATFATVQFSASIAATNAPMSAAVSAAFDEPTHTASIAATFGPMTAALSATFANPVDTASVAATLAPMTSMVSATSATEIDTASIIATLCAMTASLTAAFSDVIYVTTECGIVPHFTRSTVPRFRRRNIVASIRRNTVPKFRRARR